jgi:hypothetical protein
MAAKPVIVRQGLPDWAGWLAIVGAMFMIWHAIGAVKSINRYLERVHNAVVWTEYQQQRGMIWLDETGTGWVSGPKLLNPSDFDGTDGNAQTDTNSRPAEKR